MQDQQTPTQPKWILQQHLVLHGYLTPSLNQLLKKHWRVVTKMKQEAEDELWHALTTQRVK